MTNNIDTELISFSCRTQDARPGYAYAMEDRAVLAIHVRNLIVQEWEAIVSHPFPHARR